MRKSIFLVMIILSIRLNAEVDFEKITLEPGGKGNIGIKAVDINDDQLTDIVTVAAGVSKLFWYKNIIDTTNGFSQTFKKYIIDTGISGQYLDALDISGDNIPEILCSVPSGLGKILLYRSESRNDTIYWEKEIITDEFSGAHQVHFVDLDNDGDKDILAAAIGAQEIKWWEYDNQKWQSRLIAENYAAQAVEYCDFNHDNFPDIVSGLMESGKYDISIWLSSFQDSLIYKKMSLDNPVSGAHWFEIKDMNNDNLNDIVCAGYFSNKIVIWERKDTVGVRFTRQTAVPNILYPLHVSVADIDNDGNNDILSLSHDGSNHSLNLYSFSGDIYKKHLIQSYFNAGWQITPFDADNDRDLDIVCGGYYIPNPRISADLTLFKNTLCDENGTGLIPDVPVMTSCALKQNYPNPFNPKTQIRFSLREKTPVRLVIYNQNGQPVKILINDIMNAGDYSKVWNGKNERGKKVSSGIYYYSLETNTFFDTKKMIILK